MMPINADHNLLFGLLSVHLKFIDHDTFQRARQTCERFPGTSISQLLREEKRLRPESCDLLTQLVNDLVQHGEEQVRLLTEAGMAHQRTGDSTENLSAARPNDSDPHATWNPESDVRLHPPVGAAQPAALTDPNGTDALAPTPAAAAALSSDDPYATRTPEASAVGASASARTVTGQRFRVLRRHAKGGLGEVFVALDNELHREVALKEIREQHADHPASRGRFLLEAEVTGCLEHPGIVPVYSLGEHADGRPYYAMRFIEGQSLKQAIEAFHQDKTLQGNPRECSLALRQLLRRFNDVCDAIAYAHSRSVLHRDLKPANVMLGKFGETLVVDWGLAKTLGRSDPKTISVEAPLQTSEASSSVETMAGSTIGTPQFMSPEQAAGRLDVLGPASDVYSLGATLYVLLTGHAPFTGSSIPEILQKVQRGDFPRPRQVHTNIPRPLEAICLKAMPLEPRDRYSSVKELADDIEHWMDDEPVAAYAESLRERFARWVRGHQTTVAAFVGLLVTTAAAMSIGYVVVSREQARTTQAQRDRVLAQVDALLDATPQAVPSILRGLEPYHDWVMPRLREIRERSDQSEEHRTRASLGLLAVDAGQMDYLRQRLLVVEPAEMILLRDSLLPYREQLKDMLWAAARDEKADPEHRFRAVVVLAAYDPTNERWSQVGDRIVNRFLQTNPMHLALYSDALWPMRQSLLPALLKVCRDPAAGERRQVAANIVSNYASDRPDLLVDLLLDADAQQFPVLFPKAREHREKALLLLNRELERQLTPDWNDGPLDAAWPSRDAALVEAVEAADGLVAERFAMFQTLPLEQFSAVATRLRQSGYRPHNVRPYSVGNGVQVAAVWLRDGRAWELAIDVPKEEIRKRDEEYRIRGLLPMDVAMWTVGKEPQATAERYAALWVKGDETVKDARLYVGVPAGESHKQAWEPLKKEGFVPRTQTQLMIGQEIRHGAVWWKPAKPFAANIYSYAYTQSNYENNLSPSNIQFDVRLLHPARLINDRDRWTERLATAEKELAAKPDDLTRRFNRAEAYFWGGKDESALADLNACIVKQSKSIRAYLFRALIQARRGKSREASKDLDTFLANSENTRENAWADAAVSAYLGDGAGLQRLEEALTKHADDPEWYFDAARAHALAAQVRAKEQPEKSSEHAARAVSLLTKARAAGLPFERLLANSDIDGLRDRKEFQALLAEGRRTPQYSGVWHDSPVRESRELRNLVPAQNRAEAVALAKQGWRPMALSVLETEQGKLPLTAAVWERPTIALVAQDALAKRQAHAAIALLRLGNSERLWPLLQQSADPRVRSFLIHLLSPLGSDPHALVQHLEQETNVSIRRALILCLGEFPVDASTNDVRQPLVEKLLAMYRTDPDAGIHSAVDWLLRQRWGHAPEVQQIDEALAGQPPGDRRWFISAQGHTFTAIPGPVEFRMGSPAQEPGRSPVHENQHRQRISRSFALATKKVTVEQFEMFLADVKQKYPGVIQHSYTPKYSPEPGGPIISVTWFEAAAYCRWLSEQEGIPEAQMCYPPIPEIGEGMKMPSDYLSRTGYRLPTEAEWEYVSRAEAITTCCYGNCEELLGQYAWFIKTAEDHAWPVGRLKPNDLGLFDGHGNTWDWTQNRALTYTPGPGGKTTEDGEDLALITDKDSRVLRGGSFDNPASFVRSASRVFVRPTDRDTNVGLRLARTWRTN
jgi:serine/threonine protein kinase/formylglycine-generating enzyme required for sulfatase activity